MNTRWVCTRCFADNADHEAACARCGLTRGAETTDADAAAWRSTTEAPAQPGWQRLLRFWWIPVVGIGLVVAYVTSAQRGGDGAVTSAGTLSVDELRVGDCFTAGDEDLISDVDAVPCAEPHENEVFVVARHEADTYPSDAAWEQVFWSVCEPEFEAYVGVPYESSTIYASMITPSAETWEDGDREVTCYLYEPKGESLTASVAQTTSLRNAAR